MSILISKNGHHGYNNAEISNGLLDESSLEVKDRRSGRTVGWTLEVMPKVVWKNKLGLNFPFSDVCNGP